MLICFPRGLPEGRGHWVVTKVQVRARAALPEGSEGLSTGQGIQETRAQGAGKAAALAQWSRDPWARAGSRRRMAASPQLQE